MPRSLARPLIRSRLQRGVTLTELMIALVLGALVVLAATAMVVTSRGTYRTQDESTRLAESARFGLELGNRMVRLAGYTNFGDEQLVPAFFTPDPTWVTTDSFSLVGPNIVGANNSKPTAGATVNSSDSLTVRFYGSGDPGLAADGNILDCAGLPVPAPTASAATYATSRAYNVLFVENDVDGEPALRCQRRTFDAATGAPTGNVETQTLIRGVESFQVLFGEATYAVGPPPGDPDLDPPVSIVYRQGIGGANAVVNWNNVVTVRIAMLMRSDIGVQPDTTAATYNLFGNDYPNTGSDAGTRFATSALAVPERARARRVVQTTVFVRNRVSPWPQLN